MTEVSKGEIKEVVSPKFVRRQLFARGAAGLAVGGLGLLKAKQEIEQGKEGVQTRSATFIPIYENHIERIKLENLPAYLDVFFAELTMIYKSLYGENPKTILQQKSLWNENPITGKRKDNPIFLPSIIAALSKQGSVVAIGDSLQVWEILASTGFKLSEIFGSLGGLAIMVKKGLFASDAHISRRNLLKTLELGAVAWGGSNLVGMLLSAPFKSNEAQKNAIGRILTRIEGLQTHIHPEQTVIFFRNAMMAIRMMLIAEELKTERNKKIRMGFNIGAEHSGIEDFLLAGPEFSRAVVLTYPAPFLRSATDNIGGIENFSSAILFTLPSDLTEDSIRSGEGLERVTKTQVTDQKLVQALEQKLASV